MAFDVIQGSSQTLADVLNGAVVFDQLALDGAPVGGLTVEFSDPAVVVTFSGSPGDMRTLPEIATELMAEITGLVAEIRIGTGSASISIWREAGFTIEPTGTANPVLGFDTSDPVASSGAVDVTRIRGFSQGATEGYYTAVLSDEPGAADPGIGDVDGPAIATANAIARYNGTTGKVIKNSNVLISDAGSITLPDGATVDGVDISTLVYAPVANTAALAATPNSVEGVTLYMVSVRDYWVSTNHSAPRAADGIEVVAHVSGGNWRWERLCIPHLSWAFVATLYVDAAAGNDENDASSGAPIKTLQELARRLGRVYAPRLVFQTWNLTGDFPASDPLIIDVRASQTASINTRVLIKGVLTQQTSIAALTTVSALNAATNTEPVSSASWTVANELGRMVIADAGKHSWVLEDVGGLPNPAGGNYPAGSAALAQFSAVNVTNPASASTSASNNPPVSGTAATTYTMGTVVRGYTMHVMGARGVVFADIHFDAGGDSRLSAPNASIMFQRCMFSGSGNVHCGGALYYNACYMAKPPLIGNETISRAFFNGCVIKDKFSSLGVTAHADLTLRNNTVLDRIACSPNAQGSRLFLDGCYARKVTGTDNIFDFRGNATGRITNALWGLGCTTTGKVLSMDRGCRCQVTASAISSITLTAGGGDIQLGALSGASGQTSGRAFDDATGTFTAARNFTFALLNTSVAGGGFGGLMGLTLDSVVETQ